MASDAWRCCHCGMLMYNLDDEGYPSEGAPNQRYLGDTKHPYCSLCWTLGDIIRESPYFKQLAEEYAKRINLLSSGGNYLSGAST